MAPISSVTTLMNGHTLMVRFYHHEKQYYAPYFNQMITCSVHNFSVGLEYYLFYAKKCVLEWHFSNNIAVANQSRLYSPIESGPWRYTVRCTMIFNHIM
eukprot:1000632_1